MDELGNPCVCQLAISYGRGQIMGKFIDFILLAIGCTGAGEGRKGYYKRVSIITRDEVIEAINSNTQIIHTDTRKHTYIYAHL